MYKLLILLSAVVATTAAQAQQTVYKFDFGTEKPSKGYIQIIATDTFSKERGYGFDFGTGSSIKNVVAKGKDKAQNDGISSSSAFYFSALVPEGNYQVTAKLGCNTAETNTTIKSESRRLMVENVTTKNNEFKTVTFIVNIKNAKIDDKTNVGLKEREYSKLDWDDKLTLEFDGNTAVTNLEIEKVEDQITVFLAGNSTVVNQDYEPWASWGQMIPLFFKPGVAIANHAESGLALGSFQGSRRLLKILTIAKPGDYLFIEFGHNDQKEKGENAGAWKSYTERFKKFITDAKAKGMIPVVVTSTARRNFDATGKNINNLGDFPDAARKVAQDEGVALIDLNAMSNKLFEALGVEPSKKAFVFYPANTYPGQKEDLHDNTHFNTYGAYELSECVVEGIKSSKLGIAKFLVDNLHSFDPTHPDAFESFIWPPSPRNSIVKPDGN